MLILLAGVAIGLVLGFAAAPSGEAGTKAASERLKTALDQVGALKTVGVAAAESPAADHGKAAEAASTGTAAESTLKELQGIIGSLPERLRFSGLLVLLGALLMSVATVQFGGHQIF